MTKNLHWYKAVSRAITRMSDGKSSYGEEEEHPSQIGVEDSDLIPSGQPMGRVGELVLFLWRRRHFYVWDNH